MFTGAFWRFYGKPKGVGPFFWYGLGILTHPETVLEILGNTNAAPARPLAVSA